MAKLVIVCNYAPTPNCTGICEKCRHLLAMQIIDLDKPHPPAAPTIDTSCTCN